MSKPKRQPKPKRGPAKGQGGRPPGPKRINLGTLRVLESTAAWLESRGQTAAQALDELSGSNAVPGHTFHETLRAKAQHIFLLPTSAIARKIARVYVKATGCPATTYRNDGTGATNRHNWKRCPESGKVTAIPF